VSIPVSHTVLQRVAVQCVAVCCSVLQRCSAQGYIPEALARSLQHTAILQHTATHCNTLPYCNTLVRSLQVKRRTTLQRTVVATYCNLLRCVVVCCSMAVCCSVLLCVVLCCSIAVCCRCQKNTISRLKFFFSHNGHDEKEKKSAFFLQRRRYMEKSKLQDFFFSVCLLLGPRRP